MVRKRVGRFVAVLTQVLSLLLVGCSGGSFGARVDNGKGTVNVFITDAPISLSAVEVTLTSVTLFPEDGTTSLGGTSGGMSASTPVVIVSHPETFNLLTLTGGARALLSTDEVPVGSYSRIRLEVADAGLVDASGTSTSLKIESGKVDVPIHFTISQDQTTGVVLDFDAAASVQVNDTSSGQVILRPVVTGTNVQ